MYPSIQSYLERQISQASIQTRARISDTDGRKYRKRDLYINLEERLKDFIEGKHKGSRWICIPGFRGTGKTTMVSQLWDHLVNGIGISNSNVVYVSMDEVCKLLDSDLYEVMETYQSYRNSSLENLGEKLIVIVDEAHYDRNWDVTIKTMIDRTENVFFIITGSSALSLQTGSDSARRISMMKMYPLTFGEYCKLKVGLDDHDRISKVLEEALLNAREAKEVMNTILSLKTDLVHFWSKMDPYSIEEYLIRGSLPFSLDIGDDHEFFEKTLQVLNKVVFEDIPRVENLNTKTMDKIWALLTLLSGSREISLDSLANKLDLGKPTVHKMMRLLETCEILFPVKAYGSVSKQVTKSPKYPFISPSIRASLKWKMEGLTHRSSLIGDLLEDSVAFYLELMCRNKPGFSLRHPGRKGEADYLLLNNNSGKATVIEVGYGEGKGMKQVQKTMERVPSSYGIVISSINEPECNENVVFIPVKYFMLIRCS